VLGSPYETSTRFPRPDAPRRRMRARGSAPDDRPEGVPLAPRSDRPGKRRRRRAPHRHEGAGVAVIALARRTPAHARVARRQGRRDPELHQRVPVLRLDHASLEALHLRYEDRGVVVLGVYHPKPPPPSNPRTSRGSHRRSASRSQSRWTKTGASSGVVEGTTARGAGPRSPGCSTSTERSAPSIPARAPRRRRADHARCRSDFAELERTIDGCSPSG